MKKIGIVVAMNKETLVLERFVHTTELVAGIPFHTFSAGQNTVVLAECGIGETRAAAATALLIAYFQVDEILNYGYVGALSKNLPLNAVCAVESVVHTDVDIRAFGLALGQYDGRDAVAFYPSASLTKAVGVNLPLKRLASADKFVSEGEKKNALRETFGADICDMEGAGVASVCDRAGVPYALLKLVSDGVEEDCTEEYMKNSVRGIIPLVDLICNYLVK